MVKLNTRQTKDTLQVQFQLANETGKFMMKKQKLILLILFFLFTTNLFSQSISGNWCSEFKNSCIEFDSMTYRMNIGGWYDNYRTGRAKIVYSTRDSILKLIYFYNCNFIYCRRNKYSLKINKLTKNELSLSFLDSKRRNVLIESFGGKNVEFINCPTTCDDYYLKKK